MPQNEPMKRQFTTIDGRTVMSNLPQHWGGNDWAITGVDNPLPVGNYVQTESGVWIPQKGSDDGAADVRLTGSNIEIVRPHSGYTIQPGGVVDIRLKMSEIGKEEIALLMTNSTPNLGAETTIYSLTPDYVLRGEREWNMGIEILSRAGNNREFRTEFFKPYFDDVLIRIPNQLEYEASVDVVVYGRGV